MSRNLMTLSAFARKPSFSPLTKHRDALRVEVEILDGDSCLLVPSESSEIRTNTLLNSSTAKGFTEPTLRRSKQLYCRNNSSAALLLGIQIGTEGLYKAFPSDSILHYRWDIWRVFATLSTALTLPGAKCLRKAFPSPSILDRREDFWPVYATLSKAFNPNSYMQGRIDKKGSQSYLTLIDSSRPVGQFRYTEKMQERCRYLLRQHTYWDCLLDRTRHVFPLLPRHLQPEDEQFGVHKGRFTKVVMFAV